MTDGLCCSRSYPPCPRQLIPTPPRSRHRSGQLLRPQSPLTLGSSRPWTRKQKTSSRRTGLNTSWSEFHLRSRFQGIPGDISDKNGILIRLLLLPATETEREAKKSQFWRRETLRKGKNLSSLDREKKGTIFLYFSSSFYQLMKTSRRKGMKRSERERRKESQSSCRRILPNYSNSTKKPIKFKFPPSSILPPTILENKNRCFAARIRIFVYKILQSKIKNKKQKNKI